MKNFWKPFLLSLGITLGGALVVKVGAQAFGQAVDAAFVRVMNSSGVPGWKMYVDSSGVLNFLSMANAQPSGATTPLAVQIDPVSGATRFPAYASQQLASLAPPASWYIVTCTNCGSAGNAHFGTGLLEISTGTGAGAWSLY